MPKGTQPMKQAKENLMTLTFGAQGYIKQNVKITKKGLTPKKLVELLEKGKAATTIQDTVVGNPEANPIIEMVATGEKLAEILNTDNNLEYDDFQDDTF